MTNEEAIKQLEFLIKIDFHVDTKEACRTAISALEKQMPKKPILVTRADGIIKFYPCPNCSTQNKYVSAYPKQKHCCECGQALDWSDK